MEPANTAFHFGAVFCAEMNLSSSSCSICCCLCFPPSTHQVDWPIAAAVNGGIAAVSRAAANPGVIRLADFVSSCLHPPALGHILWASSGGAPDVWMTRNFSRTIASAAVSGMGRVRSKDSALNMYLLPVNALCVLPDGNVLILTDREAEALLESGSWAAGKGGPSGGPYIFGRAKLLHLSYAQEESPQAAQSLAVVMPQAGLQNFAMSAAGDALLPPDAAAKLQLFAGRTTLGGPARRAAVAALLPERNDRDVATLLPEMRGYGHLVQRSQLEEICQAD